jgi:hypothetical protein
MTLLYVWTQREPMVTSEGRTASALYTKNMGISLVAQLGDV